MKTEDIDKIVEDSVGKRLLSIQEQLDRIIELLEHIREKL